MVMKDVMVEGVDVEWLALILEAKKIGIAQETIREFLSQNGARELLVEK